MTLIEALFLGILQGITEFLPVSSSGHLVLAETFLNITIDPQSLLGFDIILHAGTLFALLLCYRDRWYKIARSLVVNDPVNRRLFFFLVVASVPAGIAGVLFEDVIADLFRSPRLVGACLGITGIVLILSERMPQRREASHLHILEVLLIGCAQACALPAGLSRSGLTMAMGRALGVHRREALDFSFMMAVPVFAGATLLTMKNVVSGEIVLPPLSITMTGFVASFIVSIGAIMWLRSWVGSHPLWWFSVYLIPASIALMVVGR